MLAICGNVGSSNLAPVVSMSSASESGERRKGTVAIASDHAGYPLKQILADELRAMGREVLDLGTDGPDSVDYPDFGRAVAAAVAGGRAESGVVVCGTGIGVSIAANRHPGVRAAVCHDVSSARLSRQHNDANVLALGARLIGVETAKDCLGTFLETPFEGGRHVRRVAKLG
jgi:ribose 5-phosphate isomerase B